MSHVKRKGYVPYHSICTTYVACHTVLCRMSNLRKAHVALSILGVKGHPPPLLSSRYPGLLTLKFDMVITPKNRHVTRGPSDRRKKNMGVNLIQYAREDCLKSTKNCKLNDNRHEDIILGNPSKRVPLPGC